MCRAEKAFTHLIMAWGHHGETCKHKFNVNRFLYLYEFLDMFIIDMYAAREKRQATERKCN